MKNILDYESTERKAFSKIKLTMLWLGILSIAACFLLIVGITPKRPPIQYPNTSEISDIDNTEESKEQPLLTFPGTENGTVTINSLSKLNYYSAKKLLAESNTAVQTKTVKSYRFPATISTLKQINIENAVSTPLTDFALAESYVNPEEIIIYYDMSEWGVFTISGATFFQFVLDDKNEFLASKIGTGLIDVVITYNIIDKMITFRNGDRFYSCLANGAGNRPDGSGYIRFSSHKFIEDFYVVKNLKQDNYAFEIKTKGANVFSLSDGAGDIISLSCYPFKSTIGETYNYSIVENSRYSKQMNISYSIEELENYFNNAYNQMDFNKAVSLVSSKTDHFESTLLNGSYRINSTEDAAQYQSFFEEITFTDEMFSGCYYLLVYGICGDGAGYLSYTLGDNEIIVLAERGIITATDNKAVVAMFKVSEEFDSVSLILDWSSD